MRLWRDPTARALAAAHPRTSLTCDGDTLRAHRRPAHKSDQDLEPTLALIAILAEADPFGGDVLRSLAARVERDAAGFAQARLAGDVLVGPVRDGKIVRTCIRGPFNGAVRDDLGALVATVGATWRVDGNELRIEFPGIEVDAVRLRAAAEMCLPPSSGVFR